MGNFREENAQLRFELQESKMIVKDQHTKINILTKEIVKLIKSYERVSKDNKL